MIVFISCIKSKASRDCEAQKMYISDLFIKSLQYANSLRPRKIYILSAKYGVLELDDVISPYELTLNAMTEKERKMWVYKVIMQLNKKGISFMEEAIFLCGNNYRKYIMRKFPNSKAPLKNLGIGEQLAFYKYANQMKGGIM